MIIIPTRQGPELLDLNAFSFDNNEFSAVSSYLNRYEFSYAAIYLDRDLFDRKGMRFSILSYFQISRFEELLGLSFERTPEKTRTTFKKVSGGNVYRCVRFRDQGWQNDCREVTADDDHAAYLKCSILAGDENWLGVTSEPGRCP